MLIGKNLSVPCYRIPSTLSGEQRRSLLACTWTSRYLGPQEERNLSKFIGITGKSGGKYLVWLLLALRDLLEVQTEIPYEKFQQNNLKELIWSIMHVNNQAKFIGTNFASKLVLIWLYLVRMRVFERKMCLSGY